MSENQHKWVGEAEAALFILEFSNEKQREKENLTDDIGETLSFSEFQRCFLPADCLELRATLSQRECTSKQAYLPIEIEERIARLIAKEIEFLQVAQKMRLELESQKDFSTYACFSAIVNSDSQAMADRSKVLEGALGKYLIQNGYYATERELAAIMRRMDIDQDGKVLYSDMSE